MSFSGAYIPIGVGTFHLESAEKEFEKSKKLLSEIDSGFVFPGEMLLSIDKLNAFLDGINPDFIIIQNLTFANSAYTCEIIRRFSCPVLLWTLREPVIDGTRLRLNSLTGAFSSGFVGGCVGSTADVGFSAVNEVASVDAVCSAVLS